LLALCRYGVRHIAAMLKMPLLAYFVAIVFRAAISIAMLRISRLRQHIYAIRRHDIIYAAIIQEALFCRHFSRCRQVACHSFTPSLSRLFIRYDNHSEHQPYSS